MKKISILKNFRDILGFLLASLSILGLTQEVKDDSYYIYLFMGFIQLVAALDYHKEKKMKMVFISIIGVLACVGLIIKALFM